MASNQPTDDTASFPARQLAAKKTMMAIASEIASSPNLRPLAAHLGEDVLALMLEGDTEVLADLMTQEPQVFRQAPMDQLNDHAFNMLFPHMDRKQQIAFGRALVQEIADGHKKE